MRDAHRTQTMTLSSLTSAALTVAGFKLLNGDMTDSCLYWSSWTLLVLAPVLTGSIVPMTFRLGVPMAVTGRTANVGRLGVASSSSASDEVALDDTSPRRILG